MRELLDFVTILMMVAVPLVGGVVTFLWTEIKDQRKRTDELQREQVTQQQLMEVERRIQDTVGTRMDDLHRKLDMLISSLLKRES